MLCLFQVLQYKQPRMKLELTNDTIRVGLFFISTIIFGIIYSIFFKDKRHWADGKPKSCGDCLYFAVITQTTVGFGDMSPSSPSLRAFVCAQTFSSYMLGLFLFSRLFMKDPSGFSTDISKNK